MLSSSYAGVQTAHHGPSPSFVPCATGHRLLVPRRTQNVRDHRRGRRTAGSLECDISIPSSKGMLSSFSLLEGRAGGCKPCKSSTSAKRRAASS